MMKFGLETRNMDSKGGIVYSKRDVLQVSDVIFLRRCVFVHTFGVPAVLFARSDDHGL